MGGFQMDWSEARGWVGSVNDPVGLRHVGEDCDERLLDVVLQPTQVALQHGYDKR